MPSLFSRVVRVARATPVDVPIVFALLALAALALPGDWGPRAAVGIPFLLVAPGYALLLALDPARPGWPSSGRFPVGFFTGGERLLIAVGASVASMPLVGLALGALQLGYDPTTVFLVYAPLTFILLLIGDARRRRLPRERRYVLPVRDWVALARRTLDGPRVDTVLSVALAAVVLVFAVGFGAALVAPADGETYTNVYLASENATGHLVASDYPTNLTRGDAANVTVGLDNHEQQRETYAIVTELQQVRVVGDRTVIERRADLAHRNVTVEAGASWHDPLMFTPSFTGTDLRLTVYFYRGTAPTEPSEATAYRTLHHWVTVSDNE